MKSSPLPRTLPLLLALGRGSAVEPAPPADPTMGLGEALAKALTAASPMPAPDDEKPRQSCADALTTAPLLRERMDDPFGWGGQKSTDTLELEKSNRTEFNP